MKLNNLELYAIKGGISAAFITALTRAFNTIIDFGIKVGSSLRRGRSKKNYC